MAIGTTMPEDLTILARQKGVPMNPIESNDRIDRLVRERWTVEERVTGLKAAVRQLLREHD